MGLRHQTNSEDENDSAPQHTPKLESPEHFDGATRSLRIPTSFFQLIDPFPSEHASTDTAPTRQASSAVHASVTAATYTNAMRRAGLTDTAALVALHRRFRAADNGATAEDIRHYYNGGDRQYPSRRLTNETQYRIKLGIFSNGMSQPSYKNGVVQIGAAGTHKRKFILRKIHQNIWRAALDDLYPEQWDGRRLEVYVRYNDGRPHLEDCPITPANKDVYAHWLKYEVELGRRTLYHLEVIYDAREGFDIMEDNAYDEASDAEDQ